MRISDCNKDNVAVSIEKLHKYNEKLNNIVTFVEPEVKGEGKLNNVAVDAAGVILNGNAHPITVLNPGLQEQRPGNVGPQTSKANVQHIDGAAHGMAFQPWLDNGKPHQ